MSSLFALLQSQQTRLKTRKGLILLGLQNDFASSDGKLPVNDTGYLGRIVKLVPAFREYGDIVWVRSEYESDRVVNDVDATGDTVVLGTSLGHDDKEPPRLKRSPGQSKKKKSAPASKAEAQERKPVDDDEELFLTRTTGREPCCIHGTRGADYADRIKPLIHSAKDLQLVNSHYSAFAATSLLTTLRSRLITELFVCGNMTNLSVFATAMDAARYGIRITLIVDCLGWRQQDRHESALRKLEQIMSADIVNSDKVVDLLRDTPEDQDPSDNDESDERSHGSDREHKQRLVTGRRATHGVEDPLEVDSEDSDKETKALPVGPFRRQDHTTELPFRRADGTAAGPRAFNSENLQRAASQRRQRRHSSEQSTSQSSPASRHQINKRHSNRDSSPRRVNNLGSSGSRHTEQMPWLRLLNPAQGPSVTSATHAAPIHRGLAGLAAIANLSGATVNEYEIMMKQAREEQRLSVHGHGKLSPLFGEENEQDSEGSRIIYDLLPPDLAELVFERLNTEIQWQPMRHQSGQVPRLVCCQGTVGQDGCMPVYRHPADETIPLHAWTPTVELIRQAAEKEVGHALNHVLVQLYRNGDDLITEHSDKTLDIAARSCIVNVSFGAQRTMRLRTKRTAADRDAPRTIYRVPMPHNSMIIMSLKTNARFLHAVNADKRPQSELNEVEKAYQRQRISLTFRNIATFLSSDSQTIWGQGATGKTKDTAKPVVSGDSEASGKLIRAFGAENQTSSIAWKQIYDEGSDVLHLRHTVDEEV